MARKTVERNISYDDVRKIYYVSMDLGKDKDGKRLKRYQTYRTLYAARMGLRGFLTHREEEREMVPLCREDNIAMTPYSALAGGRLAKKPGETSQRLEKDSYAKGKYDATAEQDGVIIRRVAEIAENRGVSMTEVSLAWLLTKVTAPVVGATKFHHIEGAAKAVELHLTAEELERLEEAYVPHKLVGVMAQNG